MYAFRMGSATIRVRHRVYAAGRKMGSIGESRAQISLGTVHTV
jgi:hypothetical protein